MTTLADLYALPDEHLAFRDVIRDISARAIAPRAAEIDERAEYPRALRELLAEHDVFGLPFDSEHGGTGTGTLMLNVAVEQIATACASTALMLVVQDLGTLPIRLAGDDEAKRRFLPPCAAGEWTPAFAFEDADVPTSAVRDGSEWVITGQKALVVNAGIADFFVVFAATPEPGDLSAFVVEADRAGVVVRAPEEMLGARGIPTADVELVGVRVPADQLLGVAGEGRELAEAAMSRGHLGIAAQAVGIAQAAGDYATAYAHDRRQFGRPIESFEGIQLKIGGMAIRCAAARELLYQACAMVDRGDAAAKRYASMAKAFCTDTALLVTGEAVQVLGGYGFIRDYPVERHLRDAKVAQIRLGGNDGRRMAVARSLR